MIGVNTMESLPMFDTKRAFACIVFVLIITASAGRADIFGQSDRRFSLALRINGFEHDTYFGEPSAIALDERNGLLYLTDSKYGCVSCFTTHGVPRSEVSRGIESPVGIAVDREGNVYISENEAGPIKVLDPEGEITTFDFPSAEGEQTPRPGRMTFDRDGNLYVIDRANSKVKVLDKERKLKFSLGGPGDKRGEFKSLQDVAVDRQGRIYALDSAGIPVQVFDKKGKYIYRFGYRGDGQEDIAIAAGIFVDQADQVWVVDKGQHALKVFDRSGSFLRSFGRYGVEEGMLFQPVAGAMDNFGRVYVAEAGARRVQVFSLSRPFEPLTPTGH